MVSIAHNTNPAPAMTAISETCAMRFAFGPNTRGMSILLTLMN